MRPFVDFHVQALSSAANQGEYEERLSRGYYRGAATYASGPPSPEVNPIEQALGISERGGRSRKHDEYNRVAAVPIPAAVPMSDCSQ